MTQGLPGPGNGPTPPPAALDLTKPEGAKGEGVSLQDVPPFTELWAKLVSPFAWMVFTLIALVVVVPFVLLTRWLDMTNVAEWKVRSDAMLDWAKTVLPPVIGFGSAVIGYFFGTRSSSSNNTSKSSPTS
jgi:hypothetical protein